MSDITLLAEEIDEKENEIEGLVDALSEKKQERYELCVRYVELKFGVKAGDIIEIKKNVGYAYKNTRREVTERFRVEHIVIGSSRDYPTLRGRLIKKDGTPGSQIRDIWRDWTKVE